MIQLVALTLLEPRPLDANLFYTITSRYRNAVDVTENHTFLRMPR